MSQFPRILLRPVEPSDLPLFFEHQRDPIAVAMVAFRSRDRAAFDQHWAKILADETGLIRTIVVTFDASPESQEQVAGNIVSWNSDGKREIGYWIDRAYWGRGVATAALSAFLRLEQTRPLYAGVAKHNGASVRVLQKCGFTFLASTDAAADAGDSHVLLVLTERIEFENQKARNVPNQAVREPQARSGFQNRKTGFEVGSQKPRKQYRL